MKYAVREYASSLLSCLCRYSRIQGIYFNIITYNINSKNKQKILAKRGLNGSSPKKPKLHTKINHEYKKQNKQAQNKDMPKPTKINHNY